MDATILLPPEFALEYVPDVVALQAPGLAYEYSYQPAQNSLHYTSYAERATTRIPTELYPQYKQFTEEAARRSKDHVLLQIREPGAP
jgi:hypothetical protein